MKVHSITIVGGGTSAWLTAAYLYKNQPDISITVVDKEVGNAIGVGEATLLSFKHFMEECGFTVEDWFVPVSAGYKSGILFPWASVQVPLKVAVDETATSVPSVLNLNL